MKMFVSTTPNDPATDVLIDTETVFRIYQNQVVIAGADGGVMYLQIDSKDAFYERLRRAQRGASA